MRLSRSPPRELAVRCRRENWGSLVPPTGAAREGLAGTPSRWMCAFPGKLIPYERAGRGSLIEADRRALLPQEDIAEVQLWSSNRPLEM